MNLIDDTRGVRPFKFFFTLDQVCEQGTGQFKKSWVELKVFWFTNSSNHCQCHAHVRLSRKMIIRSHLKKGFDLRNGQRVIEKKLLGFQEF